MADRPHPALHQDPPMGLPSPADDFSQLQRHCARLYGQGHERKNIARALLDHLSPDKSLPKEQRLSNARNKLRNWERNEKFRDMVYQTAVIALDMETPKILSGVANLAKKGRVDAARLALEVTGRHNPKGEQAVPNVVVAINGIPRPPRHTETGYTASVEDVEED